MNRGNWPELNKELEKFGYDVSAHESARTTEQELRAVEEEYSNLKSAKEVSKQIESELASLASEKQNRQAEIATLESECQTCARHPRIRRSWLSGCRNSRARAIPFA